MAAIDLPEELSEWMDSLGQQSVRTLSVPMLIDLLTIETDADRAGDIAQDMEALAEDLLMAGAYDDTQAVTQALADRAGSAAASGATPAGMRSTRSANRSPCETAALLGEVDDSGWDAIRAVMQIIGPPSIEALKPVVAVEQETLASRAAPKS